LILVFTFAQVRAPHWHVGLLIPKKKQTHSTPSPIGNESTTFGDMFINFITSLLPKLRIRDISAG
jgi:hypothetical protein